MLDFSPFPDESNFSTLGRLAEGGLLTIEIGARLNSAQSAGSDADLPIVMPENIRSNCVDTTAIARLSPNQKIHERFKLREGDILFSRRGDLSRRALIGGREEGWVCGNGCLRLRVDSNIIDPRFAFIQLAQVAVSAWLLARSDGSSMPHINKTVLGLLPFHLPPLSKQRDVIATFSLFERKLTLLEEMNATLMESADVHFRMLLRGASPESAALGLNSACLPDGFSVVPLGQYCQRIENGRTPARGDASWWNGPVPWLTSAEVRQGVIVAIEKSLSRDALLATHLKSWPKGTTIIAMCGVTGGQVGWLAMEAAANQACCGALPFSYMQAYVFRYLAAARQVLRKFMKGTAQLNLNQRVIAELPILLPSKHALHSYEETVRPILERIAQNARKSVTLGALRDSLYPVLQTLMPAVRTPARLNAETTTPGSRLTREAAAPAATFDSSAISTSIV